MIPPHITDLMFDEERKEECFVLDELEDDDILIDEDLVDQHYMYYEG
jgi:hypothetical protein